MSKGPEGFTPFKPDMNAVKNRQAEDAVAAKVETEGENIGRIKKEAIEMAQVVAIQEDKHRDMVPGASEEDYNNEVTNDNIAQEISDEYSKYTGELAYAKSTNDKQKIEKEHSNLVDMYKRIKDVISSIGKK